MDTPRPLANELVARMGAVLAELDEVAADPVAVPLAAVELRQVAGLTAGGSLPLPAGTHEFGRAEVPGTRLEPGAVREVAFRLVVAEDASVQILPGDGEVRVEGVPLAGPRSLTGGIIDVGSAAFTVGPTRVALARSGTAAAVGQERPGPETPGVRRIGVPARTPAPSPGPLRQRARRRHEEYLASVAADLDAALAMTIQQVASKRRADHPDAEEVVHRARFGATARADEPVPLAAGLVPLALGPVPWDPPVDIDGPIEAPLQQVLDARSSLPLLPLVVDLGAGPVAVVGPRAAAMAVARYVVVALSVATPSEQLRISLVAPPSAAWHWLEPAPALTAGPPQPGGLEVSLVDGDAPHDERKRAVDRACREQRTGALLVLEDAADAPSAATVLQLDQDGTASLLGPWGRDRSRGVIPLGLPDATASAALSALASRHRRAGSPATRLRPLN